MSNHFLSMPSSKCIDIAHVADANHAVFSENEIIAVNEILLSNGLHKITLKSPKIGREVLRVFLSLINHKKQIYWLCSGQTAPEGTVDLFEQMKNYHAIDSTVNMHEYMFTQFNPGSLVIEGTQSLMSKDWYKRFSVILHETHTFNLIPVVHLLFVE